MPSLSALTVSFVGRRACSLSSSAHGTPPRLGYLHDSIPPTSSRISIHLLSSYHLNHYTVVSIIINTRATPAPQTAQTAHRTHHHLQQPSARDAKTKQKKKWQKIKMAGTPLLVASHRQTNPAPPGEVRRVRHRASNRRPSQEGEGATLPAPNDSAILSKLPSSPLTVGERMGYWGI